MLTVVDVVAEDDDDEVEEGEDVVVVLAAGPLVAEVLVGGVVVVAIGLSQRLESHQTALWMIAPPAAEASDIHLVISTSIYLIRLITQSER